MHTVTWFDVITLLLILRKSSTVLIAYFFPILPTLVVVCTIYSLLKPLLTVLAVSEKDDIITSCLMLNYRSIKTVLLIDVCLSSDDHTLYVLYNLKMFYLFLLLFRLMLFHFVTVCACRAAWKGDLTWCCLVQWRNTQVSIATVDNGDVAVGDYELVKARL